MTSNKSKYAITAAAAAIFAMAGVVRADDGDGGELIAVAYLEAELAASPASCEEQREQARFEVELKRTDGDVSPEMAEVACRGEIYAHSTADAD